MRWLRGALPFLVALNVYAVTPRYWVTTSPEEFLAGETEGIAINSKGELRPAAAVKKVASIDDPFVLSQSSDNAGRRFFGTGNSGRVYQLSGSEMKAIFTAPEPEIYAVAWYDGSLLVGSSPNGKVYRVDPASGKSSVFFDPKQAYIWSIVPLADGVAVGTGVEGKLFRVDRSGNGKELFDAPEAHIRSLALKPDGTLLVGGSGEGRIYEVTPAGKGRAIYDSSLTEISALHWDAATSTGWAAGAANLLPSTAPPVKVEPQKQPPTATPPQNNQQQGEEKKDEGAVSVEVSYSFDEGTPVVPTTASPGAELYRISSDGFVETMRRFEREVVYALTGSDDGGVLLSTGPLGRVYEWRDNDVALLATVPEKQIVSFTRSGDSYFATTTNSGAVYQLANGRFGKSEFRSAVKDAERFSRFGHFEVKGRGLQNSGVAMAFRSGNTNTPDATWSDWSSTDATAGEIGAPPARFVQWRLTMDKPTAESVVDSVTVAYLNRNVAPIIDALVVMEPGAVIVSSSYPTSPQVLEATNPDEYGIFTSLDAPKERNDPGKKMFRKGFRTVTWKARDENGDALKYSLNFRPKGSAKWLRLRHDIDETQLNFDSSQLPDGDYELQLVASDKSENSAQPLSDVREGTFFTVDNSAPRVVAQREGDGVSIRLEDDLSPIGRVEYSIDAQNWTRLTPADGIADSTRESFRIPRSDASLVMIRAVDAQYNVVTARVP